MAKKSLAALVLTFGLGFASVLPARAETPRPEGQAITLPAVRIDNFGRVDENYFRGARPQGRDFADLAGLGVKLVIDLAREGDPGEGANVERAGMKFVRIPLTTDVGPSSAVIEKFLGLVNDPANQPVYVHCMGGKHRTGALTAVYRMTQSGWTAERAFAEMKHYKFGADFMHPALKAFVFDYFSQLKQAAAPPALRPAV